MNVRAGRFITAALATAAAIASASQWYAAAFALWHRAWGFALFYALFATGGVALALALWRAGRRPATGA